MIRKRPHSKTRTGCLRCKSRRIKCDEQKPQCSHCQRHSALCEYPDLSKTSSVSERLSSATLRLSSPGKLYGDVELNLTDLQLLTHWIFNASSGFGLEPGDEMPWKEDITKIACRYPFLMHGILAVSALSMARAVPVSESQHYLLVAAHHQNKTFPSYRQIINDVERNMTKENCHAVIATAKVITVYTGCLLGFPALSDTIGQGQCSLSEVCEWLSLSRGARRIELFHWDWTAEGPMAYDLRRSSEAIDVSYSPEDSHLVTLEGLFASWPFSQERLPSVDVEACRATLMLLREAFAAPAQPQAIGLQLAALEWVEKFPQRYLEMLSEQRPQALILLAHFCVLLQRCAADRWWEEGAAERITSMVFHLLDERWRSWIAWPFEEIRANA